MRGHDRQRAERADVDAVVARGSGGNERRRDLAARRPLEDEVVREPPALMRRRAANDELGRRRSRPDGRMSGARGVPDGVVGARDAMNTKTSACRTVLCRMTGRG
jgi:hypothetical protein